MFLTRHSTNRYCRETKCHCTREWNWGWDLSHTQHWHCWASGSHSWNWTQDWSCWPSHRYCSSTYEPYKSWLHTLFFAADSDYATTTLMITFEPSSDGQRVCGPVPIIDDLLDEANEQFSVRITSVSNPNINVGMNDETCVTIIDDDGKWCWWIEILSIEISVPYP